MRTFIAWTALAAAVALPAACVTINVYFPAAAAEKAADRIIEDIWGPEKAATPPGNEQSSIGRAAGEALVAALDFVIPAAHAQADIDISSGAASSLTEAGPRVSRSTIQRRPGSDRAWKARSRGSE